MLPSSVLQASDLGQNQLEIEIGGHPGVASSEHSAGSYLNLGNL